MVEKQKRENCKKRFDIFSPVPSDFLNHAILVLEKCKGVTACKCLHRWFRGGTGKGMLRVFLCLKIGFDFCNNSCCISQIFPRIYAWSSLYLVKHFSSWFCFYSSLPFFSDDFWKVLCYTGVRRNSMCHFTDSRELMISWGRKVTLHWHNSQILRTLQQHWGMLSRKDCHMKQAVEVWIIVLPSLGKNEKGKLMRYVLSYRSRTGWTKYLLNQENGLVIAIMA